MATRNKSAPESENLESGNESKAFFVYRDFKCPRTKKWLSPAKHKTADYTPSEADYLLLTGAIGTEPQPEAKAPEKAETKKDNV